MRGVPSHDTFGRVFAALDPDAFERCFGRWMAALRQSGTRLVAIDRRQAHPPQLRTRLGCQRHGAPGQRLRDGEPPLSFAQVAAAGKGQELAAMRRLLDLLALDEATVGHYRRALGCQRDVAQRIVAKQADYVLAVKENRPALHAAVKRVLDEAMLEEFRDLRHDRFTLTDGDHGRIETRRVWVSDEAVAHLGEVAYAWPGLASVAVVESTRAAENFSRLCRIALNLLKGETTAKVGVKGKRLKAGWDEPYLLRLLTG